MTVPASIDLREVIFINERCRKEFVALPEKVLESADQAIDTLQNDQQLSPKMRTSLKEKNLKGIDEIKIPYDSDTYRVFIHLGCVWVVMILGAEIKKAKTGIDMPQALKEKLASRLKKAKIYCDDNAEDLLEAYDRRKHARDLVERKSTLRTVR